MTAPYYLAIDIGTSRTSVAIARVAPDGSLLATPFPLGRASDNAPTVAFAADGDLLFGDAAERRGNTQPDRLIREYKRRIGDDVPILAGDRAFTPEELYALTADWAARAVVEREGDVPVRLAITVPAAWGDYRSNRVRDALAAHGWRDVEVITEPEAAARHYEATNPLPPGRVLAVYDFGGGTFDAVVLRKDDDGAVHIIGAPSGIPDLGGADFDDRIVRHVVQTAHVDATQLAGDTSGRMALAALRRECVDAKESLSFDSEAVIPVLVGGDSRTVRLSRDEFELMIADDLERTVDAFEDALTDAGADLDEVDAILLTGGSSRIPRVAQVLSARFDRPIAIDADPKAIIAMGAARAAADAARAAMMLATRETEPLADDAEDDEAAGVLAVLDAAEPAVADERRPWFRRIPKTAILATGVAVLATALGIATAPTLGTGIVSASERDLMTTQPLAAGPEEAAAPAPAAEEPVAPAADVAPPPGETAQRSPVRPSAPANRAKQRTAASPAPQTGSSAPPAAGGRPTPSSPAGGASQPPASTPEPTPSGSASETPGGTSDPDPTTDPSLPPVDPSPGPGTENPGGENPGENPGTETPTDPPPAQPSDPPPTDPAPSSPPPADPEPESPPPPTDPAPEPTGIEPV